MKALVYNTDFKKHYDLVERKMPQILDSKDAIVEVKLSSICTSDLHIINGKVPSAKNNIVLGHEFVGRVVEIGSDVKNIKPNDRVSANCETFCGECFFCKRGYINNCENGGWMLGCKIDGCQSEFVRVPYADMGLVKLPDNVSYKNALFVGDILSSGYFGAKMCEIESSDTLAIIGSGPVGMCSMICARVLGAKKIIALDIDNYRLNFAREHNLADIYINPLECDIESAIKKYTNSRGADKVIEAAGSKDTFEMAWKIARPSAIIGVVAMYEDNQILPLPKMYGKNLTFKTGGVDAIYCAELVNLIAMGKINTDFLISKTYDLDEILLAYEDFKNKKDNCIKVAIEKNFM